VNRMERIGPEALMVQSRIDPRVELAEFARMEYRFADMRSVEATIRGELKYLPVRRSASRRLLRWAHARLRGEEVRVVGSPAGRSLAVGIAAERAAGLPALQGPALAAIPAARAGTRAERAAVPISAAPLFVRA
jgi:hypothetical protein